MTALNDLLDYLFDGSPAALYAEMENWLRESRRFRAFVTTYRSKIRAKLKNAQEATNQQALRAELATALLLLGEDRFTLAYETYAASKRRGPDYTVTFKTHIPFNVEVRHIRSLDGDSEEQVGKLMTVLCDKVGQLPPSAINLLWLTSEHDISQAELAQAATTLYQLAERKAEDFFIRHGFGSSGEFLKHYRQLSGVRLPQTGKNMVWLNALARHPVPPDIVRAIQRLEPV